MLTGAYEMGTTEYLLALWAFAVGACSAALLVSAWWADRRGRRVPRVLWGALLLVALPLALICGAHLAANPKDTIPFFLPLLVSTLALTPLPQVRLSTEAPPGSDAA